MKEQCKQKEEEGALESNRNGRHWERPKYQAKFNLHCWRRIQRHFWLSSMFPFPLLLDPLILPLPCLQPTQCIPSKYTVVALFDLINVDLASHKERVGESKSHRNRRHQENIEQISITNARDGTDVMLSFMSLSLVILETFLPFPGSPYRLQLSLELILVGSRGYIYIEQYRPSSSVGYVPSPMTSELAMCMNYEHHRT